MANIVLNTNCNLHCPYCFADEYTKQTVQQISDENFHTAKEFILSESEKTTVGIIGGEPTLHKKFSNYSLELCEDSRVERVIVYTNGIELGRHKEVIDAQKSCFLINCNSRESMSDANYQKMLSVISYIGEKKPHQLSLGVNLYGSQVDYSYILEPLELAHIDKLRVSITVPNHSCTARAFEYFGKMKPVVLDLFKLLSDKGITPYFDCNHLPPCFISPDDIHNHFSNENIELLFLRTLSGTVACRPVIDILPDLSAVRCLGMSSSTKVAISSFANLSDLSHYYLRTVDAYAHNCYASKQCMSCYYHSTAKCAGGCLSYKADQISALRQKCEQVAEELVIC